MPGREILRPATDQSWSAVSGGAGVDAGIWCGKLIRRAPAAVAAARPTTAARGARGKLDPGQAKPRERTQDIEYSTRRSCHGAEEYPQVLNTPREGLRVVLFARRRKPHCPKLCATH